MDLPLDDVIRIGPGGHADGIGLLREITGGDGVILVRPDAHVAWARRDVVGLEEATRRALGSRETAPSPGSGDPQSPPTTPEEETR